MTAIEWLRIKMATSSPKEMVQNINLWFEQAKEMEKQQMLDFWLAALWANELEEGITFEQYYQTYK